MKSTAVMVVAGVLSVFAFGATAAEIPALKMSPMPGTQLAENHKSAAYLACEAQCTATKDACQASATQKRGSDGAHGQQWLSDTLEACLVEEQACWSRCDQQHGGG